MKVPQHSHSPLRAASRNNWTRLFITMSPAHHFTLYTTKGLAPNGWKVMIVLEELGLDYQPLYLDLSKNEQKGEEHTKHNPNGRIPTLIDHKNGDLTVWESGAILAYLVEKYDSTHKISFEKPEDKIHQLQWLFFQASGQGPYFGQAGWFRFLASEKIPSAIERYQNETLRVLGVLEKVLSARPYLVGDKASVADLSFITWNDVASSRVVKDFNGFDFEKDFPSVYRWHNDLTGRPAVKKVLALWYATL
ncbi:glutathione S-transferase C-terminal-like protein [Ganoderma leucocontextum]|nr:glutathione S-transferase C-terminal-like protein [Ganoderma leucocontextum]